MYTVSKKKERNKQTNKQNKQTTNLNKEMIGFGAWKPEVSALDQLVKRQRAATVFSRHQCLRSAGLRLLAIPPLREKPSRVIHYTFRCQHVRSCQEFHVSHWSILLLTVDPVHAIGHLCFQHWHPWLLAKTLLDRPSTCEIHHEVELTA